MAQSGYDFLRLDYLSADRTVAALSQARFSTSRGLCLGVNNRSMTFSGYGFLCLDNRSADRTMAALRQTGFCTGGLYCGISYNSMACYRGFNICCVVAAGAGIVFLPAYFRTCGSFCLMMDQVMTKGRYDFLRLDYLSADRTVAALGQSSISASRFDRSINLSCVTGCRYRNSLPCQLFITYSAVCDFVIASI